MEARYKIETDKVSVIIPIYNVKKYLPRCINSVINQTYDNLEIWLVDDGSTDGCGEICDRYAEQDERIRVIHKENGGAGDARNAALNNAEGEYVTFVDADDFISNDGIYRLYDALFAEDADMSACKIKHGKDDFFENSRGEILNDRLIYEGENVYLSLFSAEYRESMCGICGKLYKIDIFRGVRFPVDRAYEDEFIMHYLIARCNKIILLRERFYYHYERDGSATRSSYTLKSLDAVYAIEDRCRFFEETNNQQLIYLCYKEYLRRVQFHYYSLIKYYPRNIMIREIKSNYKKRFDLIHDELSFADRLRYGLFIYLPNMNKIVKAFFGARTI